MSRRSSSITVSRSKRGTTIKATGSAAQVVFDALTQRVDKRVDPAASAPYTVHFEDHDQDFLEWDVDSVGKVTASRPYQDWLWVGCTVIGEVKVGQRLRYRSPDGQEHSPIYPVTKVVRRLTPP